MPKPNSKAEKGGLKRGLTLADEQCILYYANKHPDSTLGEIAKHFRDNFGHEIDHTIVHRIIKENIDKEVQNAEETDVLKKPKEIIDGKQDENVSPRKYIILANSAESNLIRETFSQDLYEEMSRRQSLTDENLTTNENLRALALELAPDSKYKGQLSSHKFANPWPSLFRKKFNLERYRILSTSEKQQIINYSDSHPGLTSTEIGDHFSTIFGRTVSRWTVSSLRKNRKKYMDEKEDPNLIMEIFSKDLYAEFSRRQSLTNENLSTNEKLKALALELAADPKYKGQLSSQRFYYRWLSQFREKFNFKKREYSITEKHQILEYSDTNPELSINAIAKHFSTLFGRTIPSITVRTIRLNREKVMKEKEEQNVRETFSQDLYEEVFRRQNILQTQILRGTTRTEANFTRNENLRALAQELAADPKYKGYLSNDTFTKDWITRFRREKNLEGDFASIGLARKTFSQELFEEASRRQSLTDEKIFTNKNLKALALELVRQPKYEKYLANFKCSEGWLAQFRKKFQIEVQ